MGAASLVDQCFPEVGGVEPTNILVCLREMLQNSEQKFSLQGGPCFEQVKRDWKVHLSDEKGKCRYEKKAEQELNEKRMYQKNLIGASVTMYVDMYIVQALQSFRF